MTTRAEEWAPTWRPVVLLPTDSVLARRHGDHGELMKVCRARWPGRHGRPDGTVDAAPSGATGHRDGLAGSGQGAMAVQSRATGMRRWTRVGARGPVAIGITAAAAREPHGTGGRILSAARSLATRRRVPATRDPAPWIQAASRKRFVSLGRQRSRPPDGPAPTAGAVPPRARAQPVVSSTDTGVAAVNRSNTGQCASTTRRSSS